MLCQVTERTTFGVLIAAACTDMKALTMHQAIFCRPSLVFSTREKKKNSYLYVCMSCFSFLNALFSSLILSLLAMVGFGVLFLVFFLLSLPHCTAWGRWVLNYPSANKYRLLLSHKKRWMNHPAFLPLPFFPSLQHICIAWKTALLWSFAEVHYIISKLGLLSAFCSELAVVAFILLQFAVIMFFGTFCDIFFIYLEQQKGS